MAWLEAVLAGEPLLAATWDGDGSLFEAGFDAEAEGFCLGDFLWSSVFLSTHCGEGDLFDFLCFFAALDSLGDSGESRLDFLLGGGDSLALRLLFLPFFLGEGERTAVCLKGCRLDSSLSEGESYGSEEVDNLRAVLARRK